MPQIIAVPRTTPTPIPALLAVERPLSTGSGGGVVDAAADDVAVGEEMSTVSGGVVPVAID